MQLEEIIRAAIAAVGGNQADLARKVGVTQSSVSRWVSGQATPDFERCLALAEIAELPPRQVLNAAGHDPSRLDVVHPAASDEAPRISLLTRLRSLEQQLTRWMAVMGPRVGEDEAERLFWDARVRDARRQVDDLQAALGATHAAGPLDRPKENASCQASRPPTPRASRSVASQIASYGFQPANSW